MKRKGKDVSNFFLRKFTLINCEMLFYFVVFYVSFYAINCFPSEQIKQKSNENNDIYDDLKQYIINADEAKGRRIVAVGDLHGDYINTLQTLKMADIIDEDNNWKAGNSILVQTVYI